MTNIPTYSPERLRSLFEPRSIALIGASEKSTWSWNFHNVLHDGHFTGPVSYVNPRGEPFTVSRPSPAWLTSARRSILH